MAPQMQVTMNWECSLIDPGLEWNFGCLLVKHPRACGGEHGEAKQQGLRAEQMEGDPSLSWGRSPFPTGRMALCAPGAAPLSPDELRWLQPSVILLFLPVGPT